MISKPLVALAALAFAATSLAGCLGSNNSNSTPSTPEVGKGTGTKVTILDPPTTAKAGDKVTLCWKVEGSGNVAHTAIHWDTASHSGADAKFSDYKTAIYPDNQTAAASTGYTLPGTFCSALSVPNDATGKIYYRGHVIDVNGPPGKLSDEQSFAVTPVGVPTNPTTPSPNPGSGTAATVTLLPTPTSAVQGTPVVVCWMVTGTGTIGHTAVHWDAASHDVTSSFTAYKLGATYPDNKTAADPKGYALSLTGTRFCSSIMMPATGPIYFRAHVIDSKGAPGTLSPTEGNVKQLIEVLPHPSTASLVTEVPICWHIEEATEHVAHVALHYDYTSHPTSTSFQDYKAGAIYPKNATSADSAGYDLPGTFCAKIVAPHTGVGGTPAAGTVYFRAHVIDKAGLPGKLSAETSITFS